MTDTSESIVIDHRAADVWAVLADFGGIVRWAPNVDHSCLMATQAAGVGTVRRIQTGRTTVLETVVRWQPDEMLAYEISGLPPVIKKVTNTWSLDSSGTSTTVTLTSAIDAGSRPPQKVAAKVVGRVLAKASKQMLNGLDQHMQKVSQ